MTHDHSPADIVNALLVLLDLGSDPTVAADWPVFISFLPAPSQVAGKEVPVNAMCVYDTQGRPAGRSMRTGKVYSFPGLQITVRAGTERTSYLKAVEIARAMDNVYRTEVVVDDVRYIVNNLSRTSEPLSLGREPDKDTRRYSVNSVCTISLAPTA